MEKLNLVKGNNPKTVYENDDVHYFYWPLELGFGKIEIWKFKIPNFPIKFLDYEPVKLISDNKSLSIVSRFHYRFMTYFNKLKLIDDLPVIDFSFGSHTPIVHTDFVSITRMGTEIRFVDHLDTREINVFVMMKAIFVALLKGKLKTDISPVVETYELSNSEIPDNLDNIIFKPSEMTAIIWLGKRPTDKEFQLIGYL